MSTVLQSVLQSYQAVREEWWLGTGTNHKAMFQSHSRESAWGGAGSQGTSLGPIVLKHKVEVWISVVLEYHKGLICDKCTLLPASPLN